MGYAKGETKRDGGERKSCGEGGKKWVINIRKEH
jgi:hypothetical protein